MINVTITGNVYEEDTLTNCYYDVYYVRHNILVANLQTELNQFNFNIGDSLHLTQNGDLKENDIILIRFNKSNNIFNYRDKFCSTAIIYNNESLIIRNIQLKNLSLPNCNFNLENELINKEIYLNVNRSLDNSWIFEGNTMYQREFLYSYNIFPNLKIQNAQIQYNFNGTWVSTNNFIFDSIGNKSILYKIDFGFDILECQKNINIVYNQPIVNYNIPNDLKINEEIPININISDIDNTIKNIKHYLNNVLIYEGTDLNYNYNITLEGINYNYTTEVYWNDGSEDKILIETGNFKVQNQKPETNPEIEYINSSKNNIKILPNATDPEDDLSFVRYKIYIRKETIFEKTNEIDYTWVYLDTLESNILDMSAYIDFYKSGNFKIEVQAFDNGGLISDVKELYVDIECKTSGKDECSGYFDWSKTTSMLKFKIEENQLKFKIAENQLKFRIEEQKLNFKINEEQIKFNILEENIKFTLNCNK